MDLTNYKRQNNMKKLLLGIILIFFPLIASAQDEVLTNQSITDMLELGFSNDVIVTKINTSKNNFDTSIQALKEVKEKGLTPSTKVLTFKQEKAEEEVRQKLNLKETEKVYKLVRLRYVDDQPNVLVTTYVPCRLFEHLSEVDFEKESLYQTFHKEGRDITSIQRKLDVILADETCADLLDVKNGDPLFYFHSTGYDESHTAIEYSIAKYRGDRNSFVFQLSNNVYYS